ncbi:MAG: hypothetical protein MI924_03885 [Chloroflexales bacterium]|nr:hypothetical protein [Chloroflexales bacterium]
MDDSTGCPTVGKRLARARSEKIMPNASRSAISGVAIGKAARATRFVSSGMREQTWGCRVIASSCCPHGSAFKWLRSNLLERTFPL